ncbi:MAG: protease modulator HflC [Gemmataceae bacterium]|nr:protease modulator HflC [Gemmataceae bacterium]
MSVFTVDPTAFAYVTQFGAPVETYDGGARASEAGLHFRWPWPIQSVQSLDRRLQYFDLPATELLTHDAQGKTIDQTLTVEAFVCWRIVGKDQDATAVDRFVRRIGTPERAQAILGQRVNSQLGALVGQLPMSDLVNIETLPTGEHKVDATMERLRKQLLDGLQTQTRQEYGVELVDVRLRRFNHPSGVRQKIFDRIASERNRKAEYYRSEGLKLAQNIRSTAEEKQRELLAKARAEERILKGQAETEADLIRNRAHSQDPEFYVFLKKLEKMQSILGENKTVLLLSTHRPIFDLLFQPPGPSGSPTPGRITGLPLPPGAENSNAKGAPKGGQ